MKSLLLLSLLTAALSSGIGYAAEDSATSPSNQEMREKMAVAHEKMAACLRSDKEIRDCHNELRKTCQDSNGDFCPRGGKGRGMRRSGKNSD